MADLSRTLLLPSSSHDSLARKYSEVAEFSGNAGRTPRLVICWPSARMNAFQSLLYRKAPDHGFAVHRISDLDELEDVFWPEEVIFHAHWFGSLGKGVETAEEYQANVNEAFEKLERFKQRTGARLVWTAHNLLPHRTDYPEIDVVLRQRVITEFDGVHFLGRGHEQLVEQVFGRSPKKSFVVRHPHYRGAYADQIERFDARERLGFDPAATIILFFGSIQSYKGIDRLITAFEEARKKGRPDLRLVIAGFPSDTDYVDKIAQRVSDEEAIRFQPSKIPDDQIQIYFRGADVAVLPYVGDQLNSGAALLALSFGCSIIAPDEPAFEPFCEFGIDLYPQEKNGSLTDALLQANRGAAQFDRASFELAHEPDTVSAQFFEGLDRLFDDLGKTGC